jgi:hypothetical protein
VSELAALVAAGSGETASAHPEAVSAALACLDRFTAAFNACDVAGMDAELHFPHTMLAGAEPLVWRGPGQHPQDLFASLKALGWAATRYEAREPVLAADDKVHVVVTYTRRRADGSILSEHRNLWVVTRLRGRWGIAWRSY